MYRCVGLLLGVAGVAYVITGLSANRLVEFASIDHIRPVQAANPISDPNALLPTDGTLDTAKGTEPFVVPTIHDASGRENEAAELLKQRDANTLDEYSFVPQGMELFADSFMRSAQSGANAAMQMYKRLERERLSPSADPNFDPEAYIALNRARIPEHLHRQFRLAGSETEADLILKNTQSELRDHEVLARRLL